MKPHARVTPLRSLLVLVLFWAVCPGTGVRSASAAMNDYCQVPPYVIQNLPPNVMILLDTSGSMFNFAYHDGFTTENTSDDNMCNSSGSPCTGFTEPGTWPDYKYYGYFNPDYWYSYGSNRFYPTGLKPNPNDNVVLPGEHAKTSSEWDGNFLNWLTMRRVDVVRKVLTGGKPSADKLEAERADCDSRGVYKRIGNAQDYTPWTGTRRFLVNTEGGSCNGTSGAGNTSTFTVRNVTDDGNEASYNIVVQVPLPVEGVLQSVVGTRARLGLAFYNQNTSSASTDHGGEVRVSIGGGSLPSTVAEINLSPVNANTPLGEALWTLAGYYARQASIGSIGGPGPRYFSGDYSTTSSNDPLNYGSGGNPRFPYCAKSFVLLITDGEPCSDGNLPGNLTQSSISDYADGRSAYNCVNTGVLRDPDDQPELSLHGSCLSAPRVRNGVSDPFPVTEIPACSAGNYAAGIEDVALWAHTTDLRNPPTIGYNNIAGSQNLTIFVVSAFGKGSQVLRYAAINGGFEDNDGDGSPNAQSEWGGSGGDPNNYFEANDGTELEQAIRDALSTILRRASSGTAASVLASGEGSGANLIQAVFYPRRRFGNAALSWTGALQNLWYFVDPFFANASIREETVHDNKLNLANDYIAQFYFDSDAEVTKVRRYSDSDGDGDADSQILPPIGFESLGNIWEAGTQLWQRDISTGGNPRTIYTTTNGTSLIPFAPDNAALVPLTNLQAADSSEREKIIRFVHGEDIFEDLNPVDQINDFRLRTLVGIDNGVWKLGDIINSTPRIVAGIPLNTYEKIYSDLTYSAFTATSAYRNRGMVFAGGNDGMLHAFKLGKLQIFGPGHVPFSEKAGLSNPDVTVPLGEEDWGFIPKNAQPYLKYLMDPDYCHLYYTDLSPYVFDASIGEGAGDRSTQTRTGDDSSWRTVLIGGMRTGGACRDNTASCNGGTSDCVKTPVTGQGFSSYFALDVTDPTAPVLLWEFSDPQLGFATTGPAVVRINAENPSTSLRDRSLNGEWYVVFGSGPTGPIDTTNNQFFGRSDQTLRFFVLNLKTGALVQTIDTAIPYAFAGSMINTVADFNLDYQDDAIYAGYVKREGTSSPYSWTEGGVGRIVTKNVTPTDTPGAGWAFSKVIDGTSANPVGPVTSAVARLQNNTYHASWVFFGTGRFFFEIPPEGSNTTPTVDDGNGQRKLFGVKDPCFTLTNTINTACTTTVLSSSLTDVTDIGDVPPDATANSLGFPGWVINLDPSGSYSYDNTVARLFRSERVITDPLATTAGLVFFTTYKPYGDECALGGKSFLWATQYNTGGAPAQASLKGKALVQVSTASVEQLDLSTAFVGKGGRRTFAIEGVPPTAQGLSLLSPPPPVKRIMHIRER